MATLRSVLGRFKSNRSTPTYRSQFQGLWTDRTDALDEIERRLEAGAIKDFEADLLRSWCGNGYVILPRAADQELCDRLRADIERAWTDGDERLLVLTPDSQVPEPLRAGTPTERMRAVDCYVHFATARELLFSPAIMRFLTIIFEDSPLLFQSLSFEKGSQQRMHQDTAYVVVDDSPLELAASWIALQDVEAGSGELMYYEGSHRLPDYLFSGEFKHFNSVRDGNDQHEEWARLIHENAAKLGLQYQTFLPQKGDALIWHADLAHGGGPVTDDNLTRKSLVGHYCPQRRVPHYFSIRPDRQTTLPWEEGRYSSMHYALG